MVATAAWESVHPPTAALLALLGGAALGCARTHIVSRLIHFSTRTGRHSSSAHNNSEGDSRASTRHRFSDFRNRSSTAWSNVLSRGV